MNLLNVFYKVDHKAGQPEFDYYVIISYYVYAHMLSLLCELIVIQSRISLN